MLRPKYLEQLPSSMVELYSQVEQDILANMAARIAAFDLYGPATQWQYQRLIEMGNYRSYIIKSLSSLTGKTEREIKRLLAQAGQETLKFDDAVSRRSGLDPPPLAASPALQAVMDAGMRNTTGLFENLARTTAATATQQFERALDRAWLQVSSGAFSHQEATRMAIKELSSKGIESITYPSGHVDHLDVAVRRAVLTGINQTALKLQEARADEMGCDLVEVTAHAGARTGIGIANHAGWQGKIYSRSGTHSKYPDFQEKTGYGSGAGLGGWNCRHSFFPFFEGISEPAYTEKELEELNAPKYEYNGQKLTEYEATQRQRYIERQIRRWKRENAALKAAGLDTTESAAKLKKWHDVQRDFLRQTGLKQQYDREQVNGFGRGEASKATHDARVFQSMRDDAIIKAQAKLPKKVEVPDRRLSSSVEVNLPNLHGIVPRGASLQDVHVIAGKGTAMEIRDWKRLYSLYGGDPRQWEKKTGIAETDIFRYELHWYEKNGKMPVDEIKLVRVKKK